MPTNYRPVSLLPVISELLEKLVQKALVDFVDPALPNTQFAFRPGHSTEDALALLSDTVLQARDNGSVVATCLLDMSKAFDKVKHATLIQDLFSIGISGTALKWFRDYLSGRHQRVRMGSRLGRTVPCTCGVPQGSVLGPMLFSIYTRDVPSESMPASSLQFADDIALTCARRTAQEVSDALSLAVTSLSSWLDARGLVLNAKKSNVLVFTSNSRQQPDVVVRCRNDVLPHTTSAKYLGILIDERMAWQPQVDRCISRTARKIGSLWRARRCLTLASRRKYFLSVIMPDLIYGSSAYGSGLTHNQLNRLQVAQNRAARAVFGRPRFTRASDLLERLSVHRVDEVYRQNLLVLVWRCVHNRASPALQALFVSNCGATRLQRSLGLQQPIARSRAGQCRPASRGCLLWNHIPDTVRAMGNIPAFRRAVIPYTLWTATQLVIPWYSVPTNFAKPRR